VIPFHGTVGFLYLAAVLGEAQPEEPASGTDTLPMGVAVPGEEAPRGPFDEGSIPPAVVEAARASRGLPLGDRVGAVSAPFLHLPYQDGPTGEGRGPDPDPPARYDVFDCLTFVEEVAAIALAPDPAEAGRYRTAIRFRDARPVYDERNHFFEWEWIPRNVAGGFLEDVTEALGGAVVHEKEVTTQVWRHWRRRPLFSLPDERFPTGRFRLPVLPLEAALAAVPRIPPGAIVVTVRMPVPHLPVVVTHVGLTVPGRTPTMRHATRMSTHDVRDDSLAWYFAHLQEYTHWPVAGIQVLLLREQGPRLGALAPLPDLAPPPLLPVPLPTAAPPEGPPAG
jgi:hypothetical protein